MSLLSSASGYTPMLILGNFMFSLNTAAFQELERTTEYRWAEQERFYRDAALQFLGPGVDRISLPGVIYPSYKGGLAQVDKMRRMAGRGVSMTMIDGRGNLYGKWVIESITEKQSNFAFLGAPRKQEFSLSIRRETSAEGNAILDALGVSGAVGAVRGAVGGLIGTVTGGLLP